VVQLEKVLAAFVDPSVRLRKGQSKRKAGRIRLPESFATAVYTQVSRYLRMFRERTLTLYARVRSVP